MKAGIDFGTSTSEIAYVDENGKIIIVPNHLGEFITPSVVYIDEKGKPLVGREAREKAILEPENTFLEVKRLFGTNTRLNARNKVYTPVDVAAIIMRYLTDCAQKHSGLAVDTAVITVPAYFTDSQRKDVMAAGKAAGLQVERIINEPTAASLDYGIDHMRECKYMLVYDLGGGTLDVTVLELFEGVVDVKSSCGNSMLGGKDFDQAIMDHIAGMIRKRDKVDVTQDSRALMRIKTIAEQCKIALSTKNDYLIELPFLYSKNTPDTLKASDTLTPAGYSEKFTRTFFESMIRDKIYSTGQQIKTALYDAKLNADDIDLTLLIGGSTRIPLVSEFLKDTFGIAPQSVLDPDLAVVRGAAIQAGVLSGVLGENAIVLTDICPYSLSIEALKNSAVDKKNLFCDILINRNTTLPARAFKIYETSCDNQSVVHITAYQGESENPDENYMLNCFELSGIPKAKAGKELINISFEYDLNGILIVSAEIVSTGKTATVKINTAQMGKNLDLSKWKSVPCAKRYRLVINRAERLVKIYGNEKTADVAAAANELKKALVMNWEDTIIDKMKFNLDKAIIDLEEEDKT